MPFYVYPQCGGFGEDGEGMGKRGRGLKGERGDGRGCEERGN